MCGFQGSNPIIATSTHWGREKNGRHFPDDIFQMDFLEWKYVNRGGDFTEIFSQWEKKSTSQYSRIGSDNDLLLTWRQAIIWTNDGIGWWCIYGSLCLNVLIISTWLQLLITAIEHTYWLWIVTEKYLMKQATFIQGYW